MALFSLRGTVGSFVPSLCLCGAVTQRLQEFLTLCVCVLGLLLVWYKLVENEMNRFLPISDHLSFPVFGRRVTQV